MLNLFQLIYLAWKWTPREILLRFDGSYFSVAFLEAEKRDVYITWRHSRKLHDVGPFEVATKLFEFGAKRWPDYDVMA